MKNSFILIAILSIFLLSCEKHQYCDSVSPPATDARLTIVDQNTGKSLIGVDRLYNPDSLMTFNENLFSFGSNSYDSIIFYNFGALPTGSEQIFRLSENETDTLKIDYFLRETRCFELPTVGQFQYDDSVIQKESGIYVVFK